MIKMDKIKIFISPNEKGSKRAKQLALVALEDNRFEIPIFKDILTDILFQLDDKSFMVELKECPDYIASTLGMLGHIALQYLDMAEAGHRCIFLVLGSDWEVSRAIYDSLRGAGYQGSELAFHIADYENRLRDFEAQAFGLYAPVFRWAIDKRKLDNEDLRWPDPYKRLLSHVHKALTGASLDGYGPRCKDHEREVFAANCLFRNIGPETLRTVLEDYKVSLTPRLPNPRPVESLPGVGPKRAGMLQERIVMVYGGII